ncbi:MAG: DUF6442 family protein [Lachnospiraceae bacterium]|nr:DUF6442 family protein [Lachnospiraceae bacterium]
MKDFKQNNPEDFSKKVLTITEFVLALLILINIFTHKDYYALLIVTANLELWKNIYTYKQEKQKENLIASIGCLIGLIGVLLLYILSIIQL